MGEYSTDQSSDTVPGIPLATVPVALTALAHHYLDQTRPWVRFISILSFVAAALIFLTGVVVGAIAVFGGMALGTAGSGIRSAIGGSLIAVAYVVLAFVYLLPGVYLSRYASAIKRLQANLDSAVLEDALKHQKSFWRFVGIFTVIALVLAAAALALALVLGVMAAVMASRR